MSKVVSKELGAGFKKRLGTERDDERQMGRSA